MSWSTIRRRRARGLSMIELLVGVAIALIIVAATGSIVAAHQVAARRAEVEARLMQDLRAAAELVGRDLRRAGYWDAAASGVRLGDAAAVANPHVAITPVAAASNTVTLSFSTGAGDPMAIDDAERFGFRLRNGTIEIQLGDRNWQALSDPGTMVVTSFSVEPRVDETDLSTFCDRPCAAGSATCPPRQQIRSFAIALAARSTSDALMTRALRRSVRVRNDIVVGSCQA